MPYPIGIRRLSLLRTERLGSAIVRVTLGGPGLDGFLSLCPTEHVRFVFPDQDGTLRVPEPNGQMLRWPRPMPPSREYTVRRFDPVAGPPGGLAVPDGYDRYLLAGDITALPAIARWLEWMPADAAGRAFVEDDDHDHDHDRGHGHGHD